MEKVALYARVSTDNQDIEPQIETLKKWADYRGVDYETFKDEGVSAVSEDRPGFDYMMDRIEEFDAVAFTKLDRFGRDVNQLTSWAHDLKDRGVDLVITEQNIDTSTKEGRLLFNVLSAVAEFEREIIRERLERGYEEAKEEGRVGRPKKDLPVDKIVEEYERGQSVTYLANYYDVSRSTIYDRLNEEGVV
jgi:DNA invertase Pin-like site-specific DNA recombinase